MTCRARSHARSNSITHRWNKAEAQAEQGNINSSVTGSHAYECLATMWLGGAPAQYVTIPVLLYLLYSCNTTPREALVEALIPSASISSQMNMVSAVYSPCGGHRRCTYTGTCLRVHSRTSIPGQLPFCFLSSSRGFSFCSSS